MKRALFLTGAPGSGKTSVLKEVLSKLEESAGGFYTEEIREGGVRQGFRIVTLDGKEAILAHINTPSPLRVSKYGVSIAGLDEVAVPTIRKAIEECDIVVIDEVGKMELYSPSFREAVSEAIESGKRVLGTIMLKPHPFADKLKRHPSVELLPVSRANHYWAIEQVLSWLSE
jgi:nucleoside-triphosphatase